jgi:hypothetical protein
MKGFKGGHRSFVISSLLFALLLTISAFAKGKKTLTIYEKARLNGVVLDPGNYRIELTENGSSAEVAFYKSGQMVAKAPVQSEKLERKSDRNSVRLMLENGKAPKIVEIRLAGELQAYKVQTTDQQISEKTE